MGIYLHIILPPRPKEKAPIPFQKTPTKIKVYATALEKDRLNNVIIHIVTNKPVPEERYPLRKPIKNKPKQHIKIRKLVKGLVTKELPRFFLLKEYNEIHKVNNPSKLVENSVDKEVAICAPNKTPGIPAARIIMEKLFLIFPFLKWGIEAPIPKATLATLWVANAPEKGSPKNKRAGNWIKPAPPPDKADKKLEKKETNPRKINEWISKLIY